MKPLLILSVVAAVVAIGLVAATLALSILIYTDNTGTIFPFIFLSIKYFFIQIQTWILLLKRQGQRMPLKKVACTRPNGHQMRLYFQRSLSAVATTWLLISRTKLRYRWRFLCRQQVSSATCHRFPKAAHSTPMTSGWCAEVAATAT